MNHGSQNLLVAAGRQFGLAIRIALCGAILVAMPKVCAAHPGLHHDIERVSAFLVDDPDCSELYLQRAYYHRLEGDLFAALSDLHRACQLDPADSTIALETAQTLSEMGEFSLAMDQINQFFVGGGSSARGYVVRARLQIQKGDFDGAIRDFNSALELKPDVELYVERGELQERLERWNDAAAGYREGLIKTEGAHVLNAALIRTEIARAQYDAALAIIEEEIQKAAVPAEWKLQKAEVLKAAGRNTEATEVLRQALDHAHVAIQRKSTAFNLYTRARVYLALGERTEAIGDLQAARLKAPRFQKVTELLGEMSAD